MHCRGKPNMVKRVRYTVYRNGGIGWLVVKQKPLDSNEGIIHRFIRAGTLLVSDFTAISGNSVPNTIQHAILLAFYRDCWQPFEILADFHRLFERSSADIM